MFRMLITSQARYTARVTVYLLHAVTRIDGGGTKLDQTGSTDLPKHS